MHKMHIEIRHLKLVAAIAETGSVTRAGHQLHLTQSALSHQLRDAEEQLGAALFERKRGRMLLTPAGERLLQSARTVLDELQRAETEIHNGNGGCEARGVLRLSTECYTCYHWLPTRLKMFQRKFPAIDFQLVIEATDNPYEALLEGKLDVAVVCEPIRNRKILYTPLFEDEVVIIVPPEHRLAGKKFAQLQELAKETVILYPPKEDSTLLNKFFVPAGLWPHKVQEVMLTDGIIEMVMGGLGVAALARWAVAPELASGALVGLSLTEKGFRRTWSAAKLRDRQSRDFVDEFIRLLAQYPIPASAPSPKSKPERPFAA
jgi:LysR family transcriptional regulator, regulator for metE and metH